LGKSTGGKKTKKNGVLESLLSTAVNHGRVDTQVTLMNQVQLLHTAHNKVHI